MRYTRTCCASTGRAQHNDECEYQDTRQSRARLYAGGLAAPGSRRRQGAFGHRVEAPGRTPRWRRAPGHWRGCTTGRASPARPRHSPLTTGVYVEFGGRTAPVARRLRSEGLDPYVIPRIAIGPSGTGRTGILTATLRVVVPASNPLKVLLALRSLQGPRGPPGLSRLSRVPGR